MGTTNLAVCSPRLSNGPAGKSTTARSLPRPVSRVGITGASLGLPGTERIFDDSNVERILRGDQFISCDPRALPPGHARQTHQTLGQERQGRSPHLSPSRMSRMLSSWRVAEAPSIWKVNSAFPPITWPPSTALLAWPSLRESTRCVTPASRWSCAIRPRPKARSCRIAGDCPTPCATIPA